VPIIRYIFFVGPFLLGLLFLSDGPDKPASVPSPDRWTAVDSLRAMAHLGERVQGQAGNADIVRTGLIASESINRTPLAELAAQEQPLIMNAQARMDSEGANSKATIGDFAAFKPRKQRLATRKVRVRTAIAENAATAALNIFRPPSW
jgi:hypothetical protein